jgi:small subunit ribosomal protein S2
MEKMGVIQKLGKKEAASLKREATRLHKNLDGILNMSRIPDAVFVIDLIHEKIAVAEANRLKIPIIALVDTNADPDLVTYPIPSNDDGIRAIRAVMDYLGDQLEEARLQFERLHPQKVVVKESDKVESNRTPPVPVEEADLAAVSD